MKFKFWTKIDKKEDIENGKFSKCVIQVRKQNLKYQENQKKSKSSKSGNFVKTERRLEVIPIWLRSNNTIPEP